MSCLSFVTRYNMLINGTKLDLSDFPNKDEDPEALENELNNVKWDHDIIENITKDFQAQLNELGLYTNDEYSGLQGSDKNNVSGTETKKLYSTFTALSRDIADDRPNGPNVDSICIKKANTSTDATSIVGQKVIRGLSLPICTSRDTTPEIQPIHSKTKVLLTISPSTKSGQPQSVNFGASNLIQAQMANGQPLFYNNIPVMVVNRIPPIPEEQPGPSMPDSPWKTGTSQHLGLGAKSSLGHAKSLNFSPKRHLRSNVDKDINNADTYEDDSSDTCSQGSQDSNISDFDLSIFQMETHSFAQDANGNQIHKCKICDRVFTVFSAFKTHVNSHVKVKNRCAICGKIFSRSWLLKGHMRTHTGLYLACATS